MDTETGAVRVLKMTAGIDAGTVINQQAIEGQLEGGMDQGVGFALREEYIPGKTKDYISFKFPTIRDSFEIEVITRANTPHLRAAWGYRRRRDDHDLHGTGGHERDF